MRVKLFTASDSDYVEEEVNQWLRENEGEVVVTSIQSSIGGHSHASVCMITIIYEQSERFMKEVKNAQD